MNIRLFSVVVAAFGSLALAACTITTTDGTGGAGGTGGSGGAGPSSSANVGGAGGSSSSGGGMGGAGGAPACVGCAVLSTDMNGAMTCPGTSTDVFTALEMCACNNCAMDCGSGTMCALYDAMESQACVDCIQMNCQNEFNACANDL